MENKRPVDMLRIETEELIKSFIDEQIKSIKEQVKDKKVLLNFYLVELIHQLWLPY